MPKTVLLVEDDSPVRQVLRLMLEGEGYDIIEAPGGASGLERAIESKPDLMIIDLMMPDLDGEQLIAQIQEMDELKEVPILVVTAKYSALERCEALLGQENVFPKPFQAAGLLDRVGELIGYPDEDHTPPSGQATQR